MKRRISFRSEWVGIGTAADDGAKHLVFAAGAYRKAALAALRTIPPGTVLRVTIDYEDHGRHPVETIGFGLTTKILADPAPAGTVVPFVPTTKTRRH